MRWKVVPFSNLIRNQRYRIVHCIEFEFICLHHREYKGTFTRFTIQNKAEFMITSSYDHVTETMPHVGKKYFQNKESIVFYEMVPQGQLSMEKRTYQRIMQSLIDGMIPPSFL
jgi:hypothetical protein